MKKVSENSSNKLFAFKQVLKLFEYQLKGIEKIGVNSNIISVYGALLKYLRTLKSEQITAILDKNQDSQQKKDNSDKYDEQLFNLNLDEIKAKVESEDSTRKNFQKIASTRFGMTRGEISSISSKERLVEQLIILINNEKAHQSIKRMASSRKELQYR